MAKKTIPLIIFLGILSLSLISLISASYKDDYVYAGDGIVVYPNYILRQVCKPFMPCGVERINIPSGKKYYNKYNYDDYNYKQVGDGRRLYDELSSPGLSQVRRDQESPAYNPLYYQKQYQNYNPAVIIYTMPSQYNAKTPIKHFANTYNTRNNYDMYGNWIGDMNRDYQPNSKTVVIYM